MAGEQRFAGQESALSLIDATTGAQLAADWFLESLTVTLPFELTKKEYLGQIGPTYREFGDGYELDLKLAPAGAAQTIVLVNAFVAKAQSASTDEFAASCKYVSPQGGAFRIILRDIHWEGIPLDLGSRTDFLMSNLKGKGTVFLAQTA